MSLTFTDRSFVRVHGRRPSGSTLGTWFFQSTRDDRCFDTHLNGDVVSFHGTLRQAKAQARAFFGSGIVAVLP